MNKRSIESRIDSLEDQSDSTLPIGEYWLRELSDDLEDPREPWDEFIQRVNQ